MARSVDASRGRRERGPAVSIGMPVWNGEEFIREGIESLLGQTFGDFELHISDNASTDATQAICEEYARRDARIHYHRQAHNIGLQPNFAGLLDLATAPSFMWACHDDRFDPTYLATMVEALGGRGSVILAGSNAASIDEYGARQCDYDVASVYPAGTTVARALRFIEAPPGGGHATLIYGLMRTPVMQRLGFAPPGPIRNPNRGYYAIDLLAVFRLMFEGDFHVAGETLFFHRDLVLGGDSDPRWTRHNGRFGLARFPKVAASARDVHQYYADLRRIIQQVPLDSAARQTLTRATRSQELRYYPMLTRRIIARRLRRFRVRRSVAPG